MIGKYKVSAIFIGFISLTLLTIMKDPIAGVVVFAGFFTMGAMLDFMDTWFKEDYSNDMEETK